MKLSDATTANDFDDALWEMAVSLAECDKKNGEDIEAILDSWVEMEDSTFCQEVLAEEVKESLDLDVLCQLKEVPDEDDEVEDEEDEKEDAAQAKPVTSDMVNALAARLKTLSVEIGELGQEFCEVSRNIDDNTDQLRHVYRKMNFQKMAKKQSSARQSMISAFMPEGKKK